MGKVYKAHDSTLDRHVAIKILPPELVADPSRVGRFVQEARAASALNHPHVLTVYDIGESEDVRFIAMELVDGKTVRESMLSGAIELRKALKVGLQVAEALTAAHGAGIVHRDLKPENIMITPDGYAKVLDFGLAKLRLRQQPGVDDVSKTAVKETDPGMVMGTAGYMSPEQARGDVVDHRSDIFSLGCVLYEMVSGRRAFRGDSSVDTLHKIMYSEPEPVLAGRTDVPAELARIIRKALAKDPNDRYQSARDLAIDLRELLREVDSNSSGVASAGPPSRSGRRAWLWPAVVLLAIVAAGIYLWRARTPVREAAAPAQLRITRVTAIGKVIAAAISRDGKFLAYHVSDQGEQSLWVRQMNSGQSLELIPMRRTGYWGLSFSPDGDIFYGEKRSDSGVISRISPLGGQPRKVIAHIDSQPTFSPDGKQLAFLRARFPTPAESSIIIANIDGTGERALVSVKLPELFVPVFFGGASWSPDGKLIAAPIINRQARTSRLMGFDVSDGTASTIAAEPWVQIAQVSWMPDGKGLAAIVFDGDEQRSQVWYVPYREGKPVKITNDLLDYRIVSVSGDGKSIVTVASDASSDVWVLPGQGNPRRITNAKLEGGFGVSALPDGRIVLTSLETGKLDLWMLNADGTGRTLITRDEHENRTPAASPDGTFIAYVSLTAAGNDLCRIDIDGTNRRVLARGVPTNSTISISPDSKWIVHHVVSGDKLDVARISAEGGEPSMLTSTGAAIPAYSPDGSQIAFYALDQKVPSICVMAATGGKPVKCFEVAPPTSTSMVGWTADGSALIFNTAPSDRANLWRLPLDGSPRTRITDFNEHLIMGYARLPGDQGWVVARGDLTRDAVMITGFEP